MKSRISIEVDFNNSNLPVIQILSQDSDDVRDRLVKSFLQSLQHTSRWCKIIYIGEASTHEDATVNKQRWQIIPIIPHEIRDEMKLMDAVALGQTKMWENQPNRPSNRLDLMSPAEQAIISAMHEVEKAGASTQLTDAVILLEKAKNLVYEYYNNMAESESVNISDNSIGFRKFLDESNIPYKPNGSFTTIIGRIDVFDLGRNFQQYKIDNTNAGL